MYCGTLAARERHETACYQKGCALFRLSIPRLNRDPTLILTLSCTLSLLDDEDDATPLVQLIARESPSPGKPYPSYLYHLCLTRLTVVLLFVFSPQTSSAQKKARPRWVYEPAVETRSPYWDTLAVDAAPRHAAIASAALSAG